MPAEHTMASILLVAHAPLASAMLAVARHAYADCGSTVKAVDVPAEFGLDETTALLTAALQALPDADVLVLVDAFGATPCNAALAAADGVRSRVVTGLNVPMLWRTLCYAHLPLGELVTRAVDGARQGVMQLATPRRQNQPNRPPSDDPDANPDQ
jgi:PTS system ascorbate-specific IIA component